MLKSTWLEGKRNQRVDHLVHTLVMGFVPDLELRHKWQTLGMEGPNLAKKHCQQILTRAPETPISRIQRIDDLHFEVQSLKSNEFYQIDLSTKTCNCSDFPRIHLCKHIAAIIHFFGGDNLGPQLPDNSSEAGASELVVINSPILRDGSGTDDSAIDSIISAANDIISLSQEILMKVLSDTRIAKSLNMI